MGVGTALETGIKTSGAPGWLISMLVCIVGKLIARSALTVDLLGGEFSPSGDGFIGYCAAIHGNKSITRQSNLPPRMVNSELPKIIYAYKPKPGYETCAGYAAYSVTFSAIPQIVARPEMLAQ